ncbi:MAG TPA: hypothetical protein VK498_00590 [Ferruginibacter sp.]|nr:hypothetical protein [Ferruginibacter sp.]
MKKWFYNTPPGIQLLILFILNCLFWFIADRIFETIWDYEDKKSWKEIVFHALWMGTFWTLLFNWKYLKAFFLKNKSTNDTTG